MNIYSALQIGEYHLNHCEDYLFIGDIDANKTICAVMDGCTMATDSYFVSTLIGKLLRKIVKERSYKDFYYPDSSLQHLDNYLKNILQDLFKELNLVKNLLMLDRKELLSTLIILLLDKKQDEGILLTIGDGFVSVNGNAIEYDQDNKPDYIGFHLHEDFETWYNNQTQKIHFNTISDITIATDGLFQFKKIANIPDATESDPIEFLTKDISLLGNEEMLQLKLKQLEHSQGLKPTDDLGIIRVIKKEP